MENKKIYKPVLYLAMIQYVKDRDNLALFFNNEILIDHILEYYFYLLSYNEEILDKSLTQKQIKDFIVDYIDSNNKN